jgi:hypothetical protein
MRKSATFQPILIEACAFESYESPSEAFRELADWLEVNPMFEILGEVRYANVNGAHTVFVKSLRALLTNEDYRKMGKRIPKPKKVKVNYARYGAEEK